MAVFRRGKIWYIGYRNLQGLWKRQVTGCKTKTEAKEMLDSVKTKIREGVFFDKRISEKHTVNWYVKDYLKNEKAEKGGSVSPFKLSCLDRLLPLFGDMPLSAIGVKDIEGYRNMRLRFVQSSTVNKEVGVLKSLLNRAIRLGLVDKNPASQVRALKEKGGRFRFLDAVEKGKLLDACNPQLCNQAIVSMQTGLVGNDLLSLKRSNLDFKRGLLIVRRGKTGQAVEIPMTRQVRGILGRLSFDCGDDGFLFRGANGARFKGNRTAWRNAIKKAGLKNFRPYDLRHTYATDLVSSGVDIFTVSKLLGHASVKTTMVYAHLAPEHREGELKKFETFLESNDPNMTQRKVG